jgi:phage/plasmid-associated DNA primase
MSKIAHNFKEVGAAYDFNLIEKLYKTWKLTAEPLDNMPPSFSLDKDKIAFFHIDLDIREIPTPTWDDFINRCGENGEALMAFTWSLFEQNCKSNQYLMLRGDGKDGKSTYTSWLFSIFGLQNTVSLSPSYDKWPAQCVGKRLGLFLELNNTSFMMSEYFKKVTGRDLVMISEKYEKAFSTILDTKFILTTNKGVFINGGEAERRRIILCNMRSGNMPNYVENIYKEAPGFLYNCKKAYERLYDTDKNTIKCSYEGFEEETQSYEDEYELAFQECFIEDKDSELKAVDFIKALKQNGNRADSRFVGNFKEFIKNNYKIKRIRKVENNKKIALYAGIKLKKELL